MKTVKIFVSHRIDLDSDTIDNELYIPVRCGAIYDKKTSSGLLGDNTGDNISEKSMSFCELTVLYWAWKNQKADYYGLCHHRRYLSFADNNNAFSSTEHNQGCISIPNLCSDTTENFNLNSSYMRKEIEKYDAIFMEPIDLKKLDIKSNYEAMKNSPDYHNIDDVDKMMEVIKLKYPHMYAIAHEYMHTQSRSFLYNCFIMKHEIFDDFCTWYFNILFELEKHIDLSRYSRQQHKAIKMLGERLLGIYELWLRSQNKYKIKYTPLLFVENTTENQNILPDHTSKNIPIVSNVNNNDIATYSVFLASVIEHSSSNNHYDFIVLSDDISETHKRVLSNMMRDNMSIIFISPKKYLENTILEVQHKAYSKDVFYRIIIPQILPQYDKIIVTNVDMICREDIANLYHEDIEDTLAGACIDTVLQGYLNGAEPTFKQYASEYLKMSDPYLYVNTGLLLLNARKYRETYSLSFLQEFINQHIKHVRFYEQDMLNMLLDNKVYFLNSKWNCYTKSNRFITKCLDMCSLESYQKYERARNDKGIIHYTAHPKPSWDTSVDFADVWWKYARLSPCYEKILQILISKQSDVSQLRAEFVDVHFPNINSRFERLENEFEKCANLSTHIRKIKKQGLQQLSAEQSSGSMAEHMDTKYDLIVSLGEWCMTSMALRKFKLQRQSLPFDWSGGILWDKCGHGGLSGKVDLICNNFENFFNYEDFENRGPNPPNEDYWFSWIVNNRTGLQYKHDFPAAQTFDEVYEAAKEKYMRRVKRLYNQIYHADKILFLYIARSQGFSDEYLLEQDLKLRKKFPYKQFDFLYLMNDDSCSVDAIHDIHLAEHVRKVSCNFDYDNVTDANDIVSENAHLKEIFNNLSLSEI